ncbi:MAG: hypothetical protein M1292_01820 [Bacteroidetes bacterium]|nr:hypothetical protein [Bacteroidota bacterium]
MSRNPDVIVEYINKDGNTQKGIVREADQQNKIGKIFVRLIKEDLSPLLDDKGKERLVIKDRNLLTVIGFSD